MIRRLIALPRRTAGLAAACALVVASAVAATGGKAGGDVRLVAEEKLPDVPGKSVTAVVVSYPPGGRTAPHRHAGSVLAYVLSGEVRSENSATGPARVYKARKTFFEPPDSAHLVGENASASEPASLLAIFIAEDGAELTRFD